MSRNSFLVILGSLWTLTTVLFLFQRALPIELYLEAGLSLAVCTTVSALLFYLAADLRSASMRILAFTAHVIFPVFWSALVATGFGVRIDVVLALFFALTCFIGAGISDLGVYLEMEKMHRAWDSALRACTHCSSAESRGCGSKRWESSSLLALESGGHRSL